MARTVEVLDLYADGHPCPICGSLRWVVVGDKGKFWLVCTNGDCVGRRDLPHDVVVSDPEAP
jgi:ssDNA-binding Zn-finger/Zn-ribbon topoisomerase 1